MTGPLILITLGILFLLDNLYPGQFEFGRMWPIILIVIGMVKIFEYFGISGDAPRHRATRHGPVRRRAGTSATSEGSGSERDRSNPGRRNDTDDMHEMEDRS
jgi:hypothetical protein